MVIFYFLKQNLLKKTQLKYLLNVLYTHYFLIIYVMNNLTYQKQNDHIKIKLTEKFL